MILYWPDRRILPIVLVFPDLNKRIGSSCNLYLNPSRTHKEFYYLGAKCWNNLSNELRNSSNVKEFSSKYKTLLLESIVADTSYVPCNAFDKLHKTD
jgi:hypothetical protein